MRRMRRQATSVRVLREAKAATHRIYDPTTKQLIEVAITKPDSPL